jgi:CrcB protein
MSAGVYVGVALLGSAGALARYGLDTALQRASSTRFPVGTLAVNTCGCLILGLLVGLSVVGDTLVLVGTGFLGSFTTFSTWMLESQRLAENSLGRLAVINLAASFALGLVAASAGWGIGALL